MVDYLPTFEGMPAGMKVDTSHPDYRKLEAMAKEEGLSQKAFSRILGIEASRVAASAPKAAPPAAPAPAPAPKAAVPANWDRMTTREQFAFGLNNGSTRSNRGPHV
jgi:hypothetical protein